MSTLIANNDAITTQDYAIDTSVTVDVRGIDWVALQPIYTDSTPALENFVAANVTPAADTITITGTSFVTGLKVALTGTNLPGGLSATNYWVIKVDANTIKLATSQAHAKAGTAVDITSAGTTTDAALTPATLSAVVKLQASNDNTSWQDISGDTVTITAAGNKLWTVANPCYAYINISIAITSGLLGLTVVQCLSKNYNSGK